MTKVDILSLYPPEGVRMNKSLNTSVLKSKMIRKGYNQAKLAQYLDVSREIVSKWFLGKKFPKPDKLLKLGILFGIDYNDLVTEEESPNAPVVAFRKKGNRKTKPEHIQRAKDMGLLLEKLVPFLPFNKFKRPATLKHPVCEYCYLNELCLNIRNDIGLDDTKKISVDNLIEKFNGLSAVLVPVLWGEKHHHENALHIYLPESMTAWIFVNLDTNIHDFKFWLAHELGHVYSPQLKEDAAEEFADSFAQVLLFPNNISAVTYKKLLKKSRIGQRIKIVLDTAQEYIISPNTVIEAVNSFARANDLKPINFGEKYYGAITNFNKRFPPFSQRIYGVEKPTAKDYINKAEKNFKTPFFDVLKQYLNSTDCSVSFIQSILQMSVTDAKALLKEL